MDDEARAQAKHREADEANVSQRAAILGLTYFDTRGRDDTMPLAQGMLTIEEMRASRMTPLKVGGGSEPWIFGVTTNTPQSKMKEIEQKYAEQGDKVAYLLISDSGWRGFMNRYDPPKKVVYDDIKISSDGDTGTLEQVTESLNKVGTDQVFDFIIDQADKLNASDVHIENMRDKIRIRMRVDGALHQVADLSTDRYRAVEAALASRANVSTAADMPQSGHLQKEVVRDGTTRLLNVRVETVPTMYGQDAVLRLFNFDESMLQLDRLGLSETDRKHLDEVVGHPSGMVLVVGPTGSGKSTTLYSLINALNTVDRKLLTLEDPIEFSITGVTQVPIDTGKGHTFADELRSVLRLDPDVVMIGEIRDADTAKTAIQASITGHLLLSTFHATDTAAAFSRMIDLIGVNPIFSTAVRLVVAQRLVRRLDDATKEAYDPDEATKKWVQNALKDLPEHVEKPDLENFKLYKPVITPESPFGYKGRMMIMEMMTVGESIQAFLRGDVEDIHAEVIRESARKDGMVTLQEAGVLAALRGETTLEEVNRVI